MPFLRHSRKHAAVSSAMPAMEILFSPKASGESSAPGAGFHSRSSVCARVGFLCHKAQYSGSAMVPRTSVKGQATNSTRP